MLLAAACTAIGCEVVLGPLPQAKEHGAEAGGASTTSAGETSSSAVASITASSSAETTSASTGAGGGSATSSGSGGCCDCDGDQHDAMGLCGGMDCDDHDANAYPAEPAYYPTQSPTVGFDWDCSGAAERNPVLDKAINCQAVGLPCAAGTGYLDQVAPPCGIGAAWGTCVQNGVGCVKNIIEANQIMTCK